MDGLQKLKEERIRGGYTYKEVERKVEGEFQSRNCIQKKREKNDPCEGGELKGK